MLTIALGALLLGFAGLVQGFLGFGFGILAMGGLSLLHDPLHAAGVVNLTGLLQTGWLAWMLRRSVDWKLVRRIAPTALLGVGGGLLLLDRLSAPLLLRVLGVIIIVYSIWNLRRSRFAAHPSPAWDAPVGLASGLLSGLFNTGGPPLIAHIYRRPDHPEVLIATCQTLFLVEGLTRLPGAVAMGMLTPSVYEEAGVAALLVVAGAWAGRRAGRLVSPERFRSVSWLAFGLLGFWILFSAA